jgi:alcohol dehydrogenase
MIGRIPPFANHLPVRIRFGEGTVAALPEVLAGEGTSRPFVVVDEVVQALPAVAEVLAGLTESGRFVKTPGEPTVGDVETAAALLAESRADSMVAIGGGSSLDTAKAARLVAGQGGPYGRFAAGGVPYEPPAIPLVLVPTTAGTGSEVSGGAVITDERTGRKAGIANPLLRAQHALVDPELTYGLPPAPTMYAGVDALAQAVSATVVNVRTPIGDAVGLEAARLAAGALPAVVRDGSDYAARSQMMCASMMAGLAMNISDCGSEHSLAQAIGGRFHLPHGLTIGLVLAETMDRDRQAVPHLFERVADALGEPDDGSGDGSRAVRAAQRILAEIGFPTLRSAGVAEDDLDELAEAALSDYFISVAPAPWTRDDAVSCYRAALAIESRSYAGAPRAAPTLGT